MNSFYLQPLMTEKSLALTGNGKYQFVAPVHATKSQIAKHVSDHFSVSVISVHTARMPAVKISFRRQPGRQSTWKKATVQLKPGETIAEFSLPTDATQTQTPEEKSGASQDIKTESQITVRSKSKKEAKK